MIAIKERPESLISIEGITFGYGKKNPIFEDFSLVIPQGQIIGLLGKNGTGKSTLLYLMSGLLHSQQGNISCLGRNVQKRLPQTLEEMYLVPEEFALPAVSMKEYVKMNAGFYPRFSFELLEACLRDFDLNTDINLGELSMGQKKKAFICFALATNTRLLLMDEPTNGLDIPSKAQFRKVIASGMTDEKSIVISTHQVRDIDSLLDHITIIDGTHVLLNQPVVNITDRLLFTEQSIHEPTDDALFFQPSVYGNSVIFANTAQEESTLNLELLFNATLAEREKIQSIFNL